jgi:predicted nuclease of predicted toxin-antitoxin system
MRFKIDENLPEALVTSLTQHGHDACTVRQQQLNGRPDVELGAMCRSERRTIITLDLDFSDITAFPPEEYAGIIVLRLRSQSKAHIVSVFQSVLPLPKRGTVGRSSLDRGKHRIRVWHRW